jgi:glycosyltransferase involved in cell wall biosynthesis
MHYNLNRCTGREQVTISIMRALAGLHSELVLLSGVGVDKAAVMKNFQTEVPSHKELVLAFWKRNMQTYFEFSLPFILKPFSDIIINPYTSDLLPWVDVTYIHYPKPPVVTELSENSLRRRGTYGLYESLERVFASKQSDRLVLANSEFTADATRKYLGVSPIVIYPPVRVQDVGPSIKRLRETNTIMTISQFAPHKRLEEIPLLAKKVRAHYVITGAMYNDSTYRRLTELIKQYAVKDRVVILPNLPFAAKTRLLRKAKVYFHAMPYEHFGISIVEAMAAGCIPVVHDSGGPKEYVPEEWRYTDLEDAAQKVELALRNWRPKIAEDMQAIAFRFREEKFREQFSSALASYIERRFEV